MQITRDADNALVLSAIQPVLLRLLQDLALAADCSDSEPAKNRIFSAPIVTTDEKFFKEWQTYVVPDLRVQFADALSVVETDLSTLINPAESLRIPPEHFDSWLNGLNQARLALAARHQFSDAELHAAPPDEIDGARPLALFQIYFYGFLQEILLEQEG
jgi:hypothetical protein